MGEQGDFSGARWAYAVVLAVAALFACLATQAQAALYWGQDGRIARASLDGSVLESEFIPPGGWSACAIAVNQTHLYWIDGQGSTIGRANLDGSAAQWQFIPIDTGSAYCALALDSNFVYWVNAGTDSIGRARLDGSEVVPSFLPIQSPCSVAVDRTGIYWGTEHEDSIWRTDIDGGDSPERVVGSVHSPCALALTDSHLYWAERDRGRIGRANLDGSEATPEFIVGLRSPTDLAIHADQLYFLGAVGSSGRSIGRADLTGTIVQPEVVGGLHWSSGLAVDGVPVVPRPPVLPAPALPSDFTLGKLRRERNGSVFFPIDMPGSYGWLQANAPGAEVTIHSEGKGSAYLSGGRRWLRVVPKDGRGGRCVLRAFNRGLKVKLDLHVRFAEWGKTIGEQQRRFQLFDPAALKRRVQSHGKPRSIDCFVD